MEGMPRFPLISPDLKQAASEFDDTFILQIKEYILMHFQADPSDYDAALQEIRSLKREVVRCHSDIEAACVLKRYYAQLLMMKNRFPLENSDDIAVTYTWFERCAEMSTPVSCDDVNFELACTMFQIGAVHAAIGSHEPRISEDSIKNAFMHFQYAAWPFQHLRDNMDVHKFQTIEYEKDVLTFYVNVLLGQAQECLVLKSLIDNRSKAVVAKLSAYLRDLYMECYRHLATSAISDVIPSSRYKTWTNFCIIKSELYGAIAMLYMGLKAEDEQKFGERYGYCQAADVHLKRALKVCEKEDNLEMRESVKFVADIVVGKLENAKKENDFIYHERIPKIEELLASVEGLCKVKPLSFDPLDPSVGGDDIFGSLLPPTVLSSVSQYEEEKAKLKREVMERIASYDDELESYLTSLNAMELGLDDVSGEVRLPDMLLERNAILNSQTDAVPQLLEKLQRVNELSKEADAKLSGLAARLKIVNIPELTVDEGYQAISKEIARLTEHHNQARVNNGELHKALAEQTSHLQVLSLPIRELYTKLSSSSTPGSTSEGIALKRLLDKTREMQDQRISLMQKLTGELSKDNISKRLLSERDCDNKGTYAEELKKHEQTIQYIDMNLQAQSKILSHLTEANADFAQQRRILQESNKSKEETIITLLGAYDVFAEVCEKANEGTRFYEKLIDRVNRLGIAVDGIETAFNEEKEKRDGEKRALEEKMAALRAARETQEALSDFGPVGAASQSMQPTNNVGRASRPRLGDYKDYFRNKMGGGAGQSMAPPMPQQQNIGPTHLQNLVYPPQSMVNCNPSPSHPGMPPSPAPSSLAEYRFSPSPRLPDESDSVPYCSPLAAHNLQMRMVPVYPQPSPALLPPMKSQMHAPIQQHQPQLPDQRSAYSVAQGNYGHLRNTQSQLWNGGLPTFGQQAQQEADQSMRFQPHQYAAYNVPSTASFGPHPGVGYAQSDNRQFMGGQNVPNTQVFERNAYGQPTQQGPHVSPQPQQFVQSMSTFQQPQQPIAPTPSVQQAPYVVQNPPNNSSSTPLRPSPIPSLPGPNYLPTIQQTNSNPSVQLPSGFVVPQSTTSQPQQATASTAVNNVVHQGYHPVQQPQQTTQNYQPQPTSANVNPVSRQQLSFAPASQSFGQPGASPWHSTIQNSPWHRGYQPTAQATAGPVNEQSGNPGFSSAQNVSAPQHNFQPAPVMNIPTNQASNVDLLGSLLGDFNLSGGGGPAALQPTGASMNYSTQTETQVLQRAAPIAVDSSRPTMQPNPSFPPQTNQFMEPARREISSTFVPITNRPAAAVMPIQQIKNVNENIAETPILSMINASSVSVFPQNSNKSPQNIISLNNPANFEIGEGDKVRLDKKLLHQAIRSGGQIPQLDPNDPLNSLDPFWKSS